MAGRTHEKRRAVAQRQECRGWHVEHQPAVAEESEAQAIETAEGEAGRREDAQALQGDGTGWVQAEVIVVMAMAGEAGAVTMASCFLLCRAGDALTCTGLFLEHRSNILPDDARASFDSVTEGTEDLLN